MRIGQGPAGLECRCCWIWAVTVARSDHSSLIKTEFVFCFLFFNHKTIYTSQEETFLLREDFFLHLPIGVSKFSVKAAIFRFCLASLCLQGEK